MNQLKITNGEDEYTIRLDSIKLLLGNNQKAKYRIQKLLSLYFNPVKSEYREENKYKPVVYLDGKPIDIKRVTYIEISDNFSILDESKLGVKSLLYKYLESLLSDYEYFDTVNTIDILFDSLAQELNEQSIFNLEFNKMTSKQLVKLVSPSYINELQMDEYDLDVKELLDIQLQMIEYLQNHNTKTEKYIIYVNSVEITDEFINKLKNLKNTFALVNLQTITNID
ncbi:MAG: hypothetical protein HUJ53_04625, partial [Holdemanella sp.]|nr:hypothetical protein [Holdemanella sp.]